MCDLLELMNQANAYTPESLAFVTWNVQKMSWVVYENPFKCVALWSVYIFLDNL